MRNFTKDDCRHQIAPSLLAADPLKLGKEIDSLGESCKILHIDIMDGHFVPNMNGSTEMVHSLNKENNHILDVHLMVTQPEQIVDMYLDAGADILTFHQEAMVHAHRFLTYIQKKGALAGISLNPGTPVTVLEDLLPYIDMVLIMSVNPGYGGQKFIPESLSKVRKLKEMINRVGRDVLIQVDGGVNESNAPDLWLAGADILVAGSSVFKASDRSAQVLQLLEERK